MMTFSTAELSAANAAEASAAQPAHTPASIWKAGFIAITRVVWFKSLQSAKTI
jgi:hypothetical protein